jgi:hypothetical protein
MVDLAKRGASSSIGYMYRLLADPSQRLVTQTLGQPRRPREMLLREEVAA